MRALFPLLFASACAGPERPDEQVGYRDGSDGTQSGERGSVKITEILWSGSVRSDGTWDPTDVFVELRNESARPLVLDGWRLVLQGDAPTGWRLPDGLPPLGVGQQMFVAAKSSGCFPTPDAVVPDLAFPQGARWSLTLQDPDERLMETAGDRNLEPFVGGYDLKRSRSMERISLMFGGDGNRSPSWHYHVGAPCPAAVIGQDPANAGLTCFESVPNNTNVAPDCRGWTLASPGLANSADYSGAYASGSFE